jgi:organic radical activating enzyme
MTRYICSKMFTDLNIKFPYEGIKNCCKSNDTRIPLSYLKNFKGDVFTENNEYLSRKADMLFLNKLPEHGCETCTKTEPNSLFRSWNEWSNRKYTEETVEQIYKKDNFYLYELVLSSACDLKCIYCGAKDSSSWALELGEEKRDASAEWRMAVEHKLLQHLEKKVYDDYPVYFFFFSGGEPTHNVETIDFIGKIINLVPKEKTVIGISTNLNTKPVIFNRFMDMIDNNSDVKFVLDCSFEDVGDRCEAIRSGLNWERAMSNMDTVLTKPNAFVRIAATPNLYSVPHTKDMIEYFVNKFKTANRFVQEQTYIAEGVQYSMFGHNMVQEMPFSPMSMPEHYKVHLDDAIEYCEENGLLGYAKHLSNIRDLIGTQITNQTATKIKQKFDYFKLRRPEYEWDNLFPHVNNIIEELRGDNG